MSLSKNISILGATGSIGQSTADVILSSPDQFNVQVITAHSDAEKLAAMAVKLRAEAAVIADEAQYKSLQAALSGSGIEARAGMDALEHAVPPNTDMTVSAITGMAGLQPLLYAIQNSKSIAIANKEPLVAAGRFVMEAAQKSGCRILPIDSEHNAVFQVFNPAQRTQIARIVLTASGGPFRTWSRAQMAAATPEQALAHPTWSMGRKISIDSATMMNKALEVIEAHILFDIPAENIEVLIHPQSIVHAMVEYADGSVLAQMGASDMRTPIAHALAWPERMPTPGRRLDLSQLQTLEFQSPDFEQFPALKLAYACLRSADPAAPLILNSANEVAVEAFLAQKIGFLQISEVAEYALGHFAHSPVPDLSAAMALDGLVRAGAKAYINQNSGRFVPQEKVI
jgi:1-deoxy-D-xylulose-5-phosphate reductoisomerase